MTTPGRPSGDAAAAGRRALREHLPRLVISAAVPLLVYLLVRRHVHSDVTALVIGAAIPAAYTVGVLLWRRRLDPVGVIALAGFGIGVLLVVSTGGNELIFKVREDIWTGPLGLACLISVAVRRPLFSVVLHLVARRNAQVAARIHDPGMRRISTVATAVIGAILVVHAIVLIVLAMNTSTATFLAVSRPISWLLAVSGIAPLVFWIRRQVYRQRGSPAPQQPAPSDPSSQSGGTKPARRRTMTGSGRPDSDAAGSDAAGSGRPGSDSPGSDSPGSDSPGSDHPASNLPRF